MVYTKTDIIIVLFLVMLAAKATGQNQKARLSSVNQVGLLSGGKGESFLVQTINGIKKDKWFVGAGTGLDFYGERTIPLFVDIRRDFTSNKNTLFAYADAGVNFVWLNFIQREQKRFPSSSPGKYYDLGLGWKLSGKNNRSFLISAGYSFKQVKEKVDFTIFNPAPDPGSRNYERYNYLYRRIVVKLGFML